MVPEAVRGEVGVREQHHRHAHHLTVALVGHGEDRRLGDRRVLVDGGLHLCGVDVLTAAQDHVLGPIHQEQEAVLVQVADVAGVEPAVGEGLGVRLGPVQIAAEHVAATYPELAVSTCGLVRSVLPDYPGLHDRTGRTGRCRLGHEELVGVDGDDAVHLREAVAGAGPTLQALFDLVHQVRLHSGTAPTQVGEAGGVPSVEVRAVDQLADHGRNAREGRRPLPLDQLEGRLCVPAVHEGQAATDRGDRMQAAVAACDVEQRYGQDRAGV